MQYGVIIGLLHLEIWGGNDLHPLLVHNTTNDILWYYNGDIFLGGLNYELKDSLACPDSNDRFTMSESNGNGKLTYPVGLLTEAETRHTGGSNSINYIPCQNGICYHMWTLSPLDVLFDKDNSNMAVAIYISWAHAGAGSSKYGGSLSSLMVARPAVVLADPNTMARGVGTPESPYILQLS